MNTFRTILYSLALSFSTACTASAPTLGDKNGTEIGIEADKDALPDEEDYTQEDVEKARSLIMRAEYEEAMDLPPDVKAHNDKIHERIRRQRFASITRGLPEWTKAEVARLESIGDYGIAYSAVIAYGTGRYKGRSFQWVGFTNSDGWLQMDLSVALEDRDMDHMNLKFDVYKFENLTRIATGGNSVTWIAEFCTRPEDRFCDKVGAFEKELLSKANKALTGLSFTLVGYFPPQ